MLLWFQFFQQNQEAISQLRAPLFEDKVIDYIADLAKVEVPTQIIVGEDDRLTPPVISRRMAAALPEARLAVVEQAGHLTNLEQPERFDALVLEFLRGAGVAS